MDEEILVFLVFCLLCVSGAIAEVAYTDYLIYKEIASGIEPQKACSAHRTTCK